MLSSLHVRVAFASLRGRRSVLALVLLAGLVSPGATAQADVIFSNFGPNNSYDPMNGRAFGSIDAHTLQDLGVFFRVGSRPVTLDEVDVAVGLTNKPNAVNLEIVPSINGMPGPDSLALESFALSNKLSPFGSGGPPLAIDSVRHPLLDANTGYWLVASAAQPTQAMWSDNVLPYAGPLAFRVNGGAWETLGIDAGPAFAVFGSPVPEPATLALLGVGTVGLLVYGCRRMRVA